MSWSGSKLRLAAKSNGVRVARTFGIGLISAQKAGQPSAQSAVTIKMQNMLKREGPNPMAEEGIRKSILGRPSKRQPGNFYLYTAQERTKRLTNSASTLTKTCRHFHHRQAIRPWCSESPYFAFSYVSARSMCTHATNANGMVGT